MLAAWSGLYSLDEPLSSSLLRWLRRRALADRHVASDVVGHWLEIFRHDLDVLRRHSGRENGLKSRPFHRLGIGWDSDRE